MLGFLTADAKTINSLIKKQCQKQPFQHFSAFPELRSCILIHSPYGESWDNLSADEVKYQRNPSILQVEIISKAVNLEYDREYDEEGDKRLTVIKSLILITVIMACYSSDESGNHGYVLPAQCSVV